MHVLTVKMARVMAVGIIMAVAHSGSSGAKTIQDVSNERGYDIFASCMLDNGKVNKRSDGTFVCCTNRYCIKCPEAKTNQDCRFYEEARLPGTSNRPSAPAPGKVTQPDLPKSNWEQKRPPINNSGNSGKMVLR